MRRGANEKADTTGFRSFLFGCIGNDNAPTSKVNRSAVPGSYAPSEELVRFAPFSTSKKILLQRQWMHPIAGEPIMYMLHGISGRISHHAELGEKASIFLIGT